MECSILIFFYFLKGKVPRNLIPIKRGAGSNLTPSVSIAPVSKKIEPKLESDSESSDTERSVSKITPKPKGKGTSSCYSKGVNFKIAPHR